MLAALVAHDAGADVAPGEVWSAWNLDPPLLIALGAGVWCYRRGRGARRERNHWRAWWFAGGTVAIAVALVSPLEALSGSLASAHMVQHVLLVIVAAPMLAVAAPSATLARGMPRAVVRTLARWRARVGLTSRELRWLRDPTTAWLLAVGTLWLWHAAALYDAAVENELVHVVEHATLLGTALLFWHAALRGVGTPASGGLALLLVFGAALQSVFLSALLTFATTPWYEVYAHTTAAWGLDPLADQQLAGVIMWVPAGFVYVGVGLAMLASWIRGSDRDPAALGFAPDARTRPEAAVTASSRLDATADAPRSPSRAPSRRTP